MNHPPSRSFLAAGICAAGLLLLAGRAAAQNPGYDPNRAVVGAVASPYWGYTYTPYAPSSPLHDAATAVHAGADYLRAEGEFLVKKQEVNLLRVEVRDKWLDLHRKELEHWEWVRDFRAAAYINQLDRERKVQVEYNRRVPQVAEIITAAPLNSLYDDLKLRPELPAAGSATIDEDCLLHINVTVSGRGNVGMLKSDKILWPRLLLRAKFADDRDKIERLLTRGKKLALGRKKTQEEMAEVLDGLDAAVGGCRDRLDLEIRAGVNDSDCNPCHQIEVLKFLREVVDATFILKRSDAATYFEPPEGKTVAELVAHMKKNGLRFAPAAVDDERYYVALHRALADEVTRLKNQETPSSKP